MLISELIIFLSVAIGISHLELFTTFEGRSSTSNNLRISSVGGFFMHSSISNEVKNGRYVKQYIS